jgi:hypothetical protein
MTGRAISLMRLLPGLTLDGDKSSAAMTRDGASDLFKK